MGVRITWGDRNDGASQEDGFRIYRSGGPISVLALPAPIATLGPNARAFDDLSAPTGVLYYAIGTYKGDFERVATQPPVQFDAGGDVEVVGFLFSEVVIGLGDATQLVGSTFVDYGSTFGWTSDAYGHVEWVVDVEPSWEEAIDAELEVFIWEVTTTSFTDNDWGVPFVRFEDEFGVSIGGYFTNSISNNSAIDYVHKVAIPAGTRAIYYGWLAKRDAGTELSFYPYSTFTVKIEPVTLHFAAITRLMGFWDIPNDAAEVATWTNEFGGGLVFYSNAQWDGNCRWLLDGRLLGGNNGANPSLHYKKIFLPAEYKAGDVLFELSGLGGSVSGDSSNCEMYLYDDTDTLIGTGIGFTTAGTTTAWGQSYGVPRRATKQIDMSSLGVTPSYVKVKIRLSGSSWLDGGVACINLQVSRAL